MVENPAAQARELINQGELEKAYNLVFELAKNGDIEAQNILGDIFCQPKTKFENYESAAEWFKKSAGQGSDYACYMLSLLYELGLGVKQDFDAAFRYGDESAKRGNPVSILRVAYLLLNGVGVKADVERALKMALELGEHGMPEALAFLAEAYLYGAGVEPNEQLASEYFRKAVASGYKAILPKLEQEAQKGNLNAQFQLGECYAEGVGVKEDKGKAIFWLKKAASGGFVQAVFRMGEIFELGQGVEVDLSQAFKYYYKAAQKGFHLAQIKVAQCYNIGQGVETNLEEAYRWIRYSLSTAEETESPELTSVAKSLEDTLGSETTERIKKEMLA